MTEPIRGKVARILNSREMVINVGSKGGVTIGMRFDVMDTKGENITDPDTGQLLGSVERQKVRVEISKVQENLSVASTYKKRTVNVGGGSMGLASQMFMPARWVTKYETLKTDEQTWEDLHETDSYVKTGDPVVEVLNDIDEGSEPARAAEATRPSEEARPG